jgi:23S rRNA (pseudouridine1915-N3)-methyltransferase
LKLSILAVGRLKAGPEKMLAAEYLTRIEGLGRKAGITRVIVSETIESQKSTALARKEEEANYFATLLPQRATTIVLDERGKSLASESFAHLLQKTIDNGSTDLVFLIGGPDGHAEKTKATADHLLSLGAMTWPHRLVRVMLLEQIYRALAILAGHPYHRS